MTLRPHPSWGRFLPTGGPSYELSWKCANPWCQVSAANAHHVFSRKQLGVATDWVLDTETGDMIPNKLGLCGSGTTGCHGDITGGIGGHNAQIRYLDEERAFYWVDLRTREGAPIESFAPRSVVELSEWLEAQGRDEEAARLLAQVPIPQ